MKNLIKFVEIKQKWIEQPAVLDFLGHFKQVSCKFSCKFLDDSVKWEPSF